MVHSPFFYQNILNIQITTKQIADSNLTTKIKARGDNSTLELMHQTGVKGLAEGLRPSHPPLLQWNMLLQFLSMLLHVQVYRNNPSLTSNNCHLHSLPTPPNSVGRGDETEEEFTRWVFRKHPWLIDNCTARADTRKHEYSVPYQKCRAI